MNNPIRYRGAVVEDVPGAPWMVAYGRRDSGRAHFALMRACPGYASDELRLACWDSLVADVFGVCDLCGAVAAIPPELKVASPDQSFVTSVPMPHRDDCPCACERLQVLDRRDSPDGLGTAADLSDEAAAAINRFLAAAMTPLQVLGLADSRPDDEVTF